MTKLGKIYASQKLPKYPKKEGGGLNGIASDKAFSESSKSGL